MKKEELQQNMKDRMQQFEDGGLRLLKKGQKGIVHAIFSRFGLVLLLMLLQVGVLWSVFRWFGGLLPHYFGGSVAMSAFMVVYILNSEMDNSAKITWMSPSPSCRSWVCRCFSTSRATSATTP